MPYVLGKEIPEFERLFLAGPEQYVESGVDLRTQTAVTAVDATDRTLVAGGETIKWDRLIVCSGFNYTLPQIPGTDLDGVTYVKNIRRGVQLNERLNGVKKAVVLESTPLGVEMLTAFAHRGIETHLVDPGAWLLSHGRRPGHRRAGAEEPRGAGMHPALRRRGDGASRVATAGSARSQTSAGEIEADICVVATHKEPETTLARADGHSSSARPAASSWTSRCGPRSTACSPPVTASRCRRA